MNDLVSIIVPIYKVEKELSRCLDSIVNQTYNNTEIILIDDGSPDNCGSIADNYAQKYSNIIAIHQNNQGVSAARNAGLDIASGDYISFVDSDDYIELNMIEVMVSSLKRNQADIVTCGRFDEYHNKTIIRSNSEKEISLDAESTMKKTLMGNEFSMATWDKIYKKKIWSNIRFPVGRTYEDMCIMPQLIAKANLIVHVGLPLYHYCHRENSITTNINKKSIRDYYFAVKEIQLHTRNFFSDIAEELIYYMNLCHLHILHMCISIGYTGKEKEEAKDYLKNNWNNSYSIKNMTKINKIKYLLINIHLYKLARIVKKVFFK